MCLSVFHIFESKKTWQRLRWLVLVTRNPIVCADLSFSKEKSMCVQISEWDSYMSVLCVLWHMHKDKGVYFSGNLSALSTQLLTTFFIYPLIIWWIFIYSIKTFQTFLAHRAFPIPPSSPSELTVFSPWTFVPSQLSQMPRVTWRRIQGSLPSMNDALNRFSLWN
jgi:hypothetical protein